MSSTAPGRMADDISAPVEVTNGATGALGVFVYALAGGVARFTIPTAWRGRYISFQCDGGTGLYLLFGGATVAATIATASTITAEAIEFEATSCWKIPADTTQPIRVPTDPAVTKFSVIGASAAGHARAYMSTGDGDEA